MATQTEAEKVNKQQETIETIETSKQETSSAVVKKEKSSESQSSEKKMKQPKFIKKVIALPLVKEGLQHTQKFVIQFPIGKQLYDQSYSLLKVIKKQAKKTKQTSTFTYIFPKDGYVRQSIKTVDGWASQSFDKVTTHLPLIQQPSQTIVNTLVVQPQEFVVIQWKRSKQLPNFLKKNVDYLLKLPALTQLESEYHKNIEPITVSMRSQWNHVHFFKK
ncbi:hypothetical protein BJ944DRAFT_245470 [Cunninghamella echinulata]|nr:hypothetical protein BJ944DRAFT_245470 [Cunninghamella echinulata]